MKFKRELYKIGGGADAISYELTDDYGHCLQLTASEALDLLEWLNSLRSQIMHDMYPDALTLEGVALPHPPELPSWLDDLEL